MRSNRRQERHPITTICGKCEKEWPTDSGAQICPECGNDGEIEGHVVRQEAEDMESEVGVIYRCKKDKIAWRVTLIKNVQIIEGYDRNGRAVKNEFTTFQWKDGSWHNNPDWEACPKCGRLIYGNAIEGTYNPNVKCGAKCRNATGPNCECSCAGENHGDNYQV